MTCFLLGIATFTAGFRISAIGGCLLACLVVIVATMSNADFDDSLVSLVFIPACDDTFVDFKALVTLGDSLEDLFTPLVTGAMTTYQASSATGCDQPFVTQS